jgi:hypothetical protein
MSQVIIYTDPTYGVVVCIPSGEIPIAEVQTKDVPAGLVSEIIDKSTLPSDTRFQEAWEWAGTGNPVVENLAKVKIKAIELLKAEATRSALAAQKAEMLFETNPYSTTEIRDAYLACKSDIQNATVVSTAQHCLNSFTTTYGV